MNEHIILYKNKKYRYQIFICLLVCLVFSSNGLFAQLQETIKPEVLKKLSMEELMNIEVTTVSKRPEKLTEVASAIQVITQDDIRRSGATSVPEALRLASNLQVAQVNSSQWAISARGFDNVLANKLLVMIDGRTVYTPLYAGVFWDVQNILLEDVDRIEVVSGPGGTMWGANAVNGVINIITKSAKNTQGFFVEAARGTELPGLGSLRYGCKISDNVSFRVYGTAFKRGNTIYKGNPSKNIKDDSIANDNWTMAQRGVRFDWTPSQKDQATIQSNIYDNRPDPDSGKPIVASGNNILGRWNHQVSDKSNFQLQLYYDKTWRDFRNGGLTETLKTYDLDIQQRFQLGRIQKLVCGMDFRLMDHTMQNLPFFGFLPEQKWLHIYSIFLQDEIALIKDRVHFTLGSKIENNSYTGFQYQPNARLSWTPNGSQNIWASVSRAVRTPARIDRDFYSYLAPGIPLIMGNPAFVSETVIAYEMGWRIQPRKTFFFSLSTFYNVYNNIRSAEPGQLFPPLNLPITFGNGVKGNTYGVELQATDQLTNWWRVRFGYTFLNKDLKVKPSSSDLNGGTAESDDPKHQFLLQSMMDLPGRIEFGTVLRYIDKLPKPDVPGYFGLDVRIGWKLNKFLDLSVVGQNLLYDSHSEFVPANPPARKIQRSCYGKIICRF